MKPYTSGCQSVSARRQNTCAPQAAPRDCAPEVRRYAHPIVRAVPRQTAQECPALHSVLCALAGQNQVLCAMKSELDEILALLQEEHRCGER